jgi:hypothetical protein
MPTKFARYTIKKLSIFSLVILTVFLGKTLSVNAEKLTCFVDVCMDSSSVELTKSDIPGAPSYPVRTFLGTQQFSNEKLLAQMEVNCRQRQFRTVRVSEDGENWSNFDPRWTLTEPNTSLSKLIEYTCKWPIARQ